MMATATTPGTGYIGRQMGPLERQLRQGEYGLFKFSPMFESNFVQISKEGGPIEIHNREEIVTVGITSTSRALLIPNILLLARPIVPPEDFMAKDKSKLHNHPPVRYELTRLFPLRFVKITVHNMERQQLRFKLANGRIFYLQLCPDSERREDLFEAWVRIVQLLRPPSEATLSAKEKTKKTKSQTKSPKLQNAAKPSQLSKTPSPRRKAGTKNKWNVRDATKKASTQQKKVKKSRKPPPPSESSIRRQVTISSTNAETMKAPDRLPSLELEETAKKQEGTKEEEEEEATKAKHRSPSSGKAEAISTSRSSAVKKSSPQPKRKSDSKRNRGSRSRSGHRGAARKPSKMASLLKICVWGSPKKDKGGTKDEAKGRNAEQREANS
ncbi:hypothetical protein JRQ81_005174 [Phrynocephalus forsythii]|uniref:Golgi associated RAB2 interactor protein-like Rab2B-binding domain-containing protein n=1 Tax=Phrynocephalus forsythii TaxID=171643 RepID=A0A9Q0XH10_9SAUR|nr:hypothetical protein JRQ81_005174 [Phrynocephalus forsythii]